MIVSTLEFIEYVVRLASSVPNAFLKVIIKKCVSTEKKRGHTRNKYLSHCGKCKLLKRCEDIVPRWRSDD